MLRRNREFLKSEQALTSIDLKTLASIGLYPFFVKTKNLLANERRYLRTWAKSMKVVEVDNVETNNDKNMDEHGNHQEVRKQE